MTPTRTFYFGRRLASSTWYVYRERNPLRQLVASSLERNNESTGNLPGAQGPQTDWNK
jgi:hypothetical protein